MYIVYKNEIIYKNTIKVCKYWFVYTTNTNEIESKSVSVYVALFVNGCLLYVRTFRESL